MRTYRDLMAEYDMRELAWELEYRRQQREAMMPEIQRQAHGGNIAIACFDAALVFVLVFGLVALWMQ